MKTDMGTLLVPRVSAMFRLRLGELFIGFLFEVESFCLLLQCGVVLISLDCLDRLSPTGRILNFIKEYII